MNRENPFASPLADTAPIAPRALPGGVWRDGSLLVIAKGASLPNRCVRCNAAANDKSLRVRLAWHPPLAYLGLLGGVLPYVIIAMIMTKRLEVRVGICQRHARRRLAYMLVTTLVFLLGIGMITVVLTGNVRSGWLVLIGMATMLFSVIAGIIGSRFVWPKHIAQDVGWVKGACPEYLDTLPDLAG